MTTTTNVQQVKVNKVTQAQYDSMTKNDNEFYVIVDKEYLDGITSADVTAALGYTPISAVTSNMITSALGFTPANASGVQTVQDMTTLSSGTITLTDANSLYVRQPSAATTVTFSNSTSASSTKAYTFELCIKMTTVYAISWPSSVTWQDGEIPDLSSTGTYFLAFRTIDGGSTWLGNLQGKW